MALEWKKLQRDVDEFTAKSPICQSPQEFIEGAALLSRVTTMVCQSPPSLLLEHERILDRSKAREVVIGIDHAKGPSRTVVVEARRTEDGRLEFVLPRKPSPPPSPTSTPPGASSPRTSD